VQYVRRQLGLQVCAIAKLGDLMQYLESSGASASGDDHARVLAYRQRYGVDESSE
jgi:orotate phosphoribosyltransferase